jgi:hypothetical protein
MVELLFSEFSLKTQMFDFCFILFIESKKPQHSWAFGLVLGSEGKNSDFLQGWCGSSSRADRLIAKSKLLPKLDADFMSGLWATDCSREKILIPGLTGLFSFCSFSFFSLMFPKLPSLICS